MKCEKNKETTKCNKCRVTYDICTNMKMESSYVSKKLVESLNVTKI